MKHTVLRFLSALILLLPAVTALAKTPDAPFCYYSQIHSREKLSPASPRALRARADAGDGEAMLVLAEAMHEISPDSALLWLKRGADKGHAKAQLLLGMHFLQTKGGEREALALLEQAADQGEEAALARLSMRALMQGEPIPFDKLQRWLPLAIAQKPVNISSTHVFKQYPPEPVAAFLSQLRDKAANGDPNTAFILGYCLAEGIGSPKNTAEAEKWLGTAAEKGHGHAAWTLHKRAVDTQQVDKAGVWLRLAVENGNAYALRQMADFASDGGQSKHKLAAAAPFLTRAAELGDPDAALQLAEQHRQGLLPGGKSAAEKWYIKAAEGGYTDALEKIASMYAHEAPASPELAVQWQQRIAEDKKAFTQEALTLMTP